MRHEQPYQRPDDRVAHAPRLVSQERGRQKGLQGGKPHVGGQHVQMIAQMDAAAARQDREQRRQEGGNRERA